MNEYIFWPSTQRFLLEVYNMEKQRLKKQEAEKLGGSEPKEPYVRRDTRPGADQTGHRQRSDANKARRG